MWDGVLARQISELLGNWPNSRPGVLTPGNWPVLLLFGGQKFSTVCLDSFLLKNRLLNGREAAV
jgi:hypothetical protein